MGHTLLFSIPWATGSSPHTPEGTDGQSRRLTPNDLLSAAARLLSGPATESPGALRPTQPSEAKAESSEATEERRESDAVEKPVQVSRPSGEPRQPKSPFDQVGAPRAPAAPSASGRDPFSVRTPEQRNTATSRDLFSTAPIRDTSRTHLAFSTGRERARAPEVSHSPPLGSAFATRRSTPEAAPAVAPAAEAITSPDARAAEASFEQGLGRFERGDYEGALDAWRLAASLVPSNRTYQANLRRLERLLTPETPNF